MKLLEGKVALITGGTRGIGKGIVEVFAAQGAKIAFTYAGSVEKARELESTLGSSTQIKAYQSDASDYDAAQKLVDDVMAEFGKIDILINNAGIHWESKSIEDISTKQLIDTFTSNFYSFFWLCKFAIPHLSKGDSIINTVSVTAFRGSDHLLDYAATKGAVLSFTRSLSSNLAEKGIRVNAVAPGPIWTPLIASTFSKKQVSEFGSDTPMKRAGEPNEVATCFLFLASEDSSYITGQVLHPNGGEIVNG